MSSLVVSKEIPGESKCIGLQSNKDWWGTRILIDNKTKGVLNLDDIHSQNRKCNVFFITVGFICVLELNVIPCCKLIIFLLLDIFPSLEEYGGWQLTVFDYVKPLSSHIFRQEIDTYYRRVNVKSSSGCKILSNLLWGFAP